MDLYIAQRDDHPALKIGRSSQPFDRVKQLSKGHVFETQLLALFENKGPLERFIHEALHEHRIKGTEWFDCDLEKAREVIMNTEHPKNRKSNPRYHAAWRLKKGISIKSTKYLDLNTQALV